jgi:hypothetical protein
MSDKKTIDVRDGDEWTVDSDGHLWQYRDGYCRCAIRTGCDAEIDAPPIKNDDENPILYEAAIATLTAWGYTLTPAKPEQPDHFGDSNEMVAATVKRLEDRVATAEAGAKFAVSGYNKAHALDFDVGELKNRVAKLEAATPAKVRVVAPWFVPTADPDDEFDKGYRCADRYWRAALSAAGVEVKEVSK